MLARGLTQGRSHILGVVAYGLDYFGPSRVLTGIEEQAAEMGYSISLNLIHQPETDDVDGLLNGLFGRQVDGIVWAIPEVGDNRRWSRTTSPTFPVPVLLVGGMADEGSMPSIGDRQPRHRAAGNGPPDRRRAPGGSVSSPGRSAGGRRANVSAGGAQSLEDARPSGARRASSSRVTGARTAARRASARFWSQRPDIDAVFASNDQMALGVLHAIHRSVVAFPTISRSSGSTISPRSSHFWPSLTTVHQPLRDAGALAVRQIDQWISARLSWRTPDGPPPSPAMLLQPELILRESSRPPAPGFN